MGLDKVVENIRSEGRSQASGIVAAAQKEADAILADAKRQAADIMARRQQEASAAADGHVKREIAHADLESRRLRLMAERELMTAIRVDVEKRLAALPAASREAHLKTLAARAKVEGGKIWVAKQDESVAQKIGLTVAETFEGLGGLVVESADGATRENFRYETLLDEIWQASLPQVAAKLLKH